MTDISRFHYSTAQSDTMISQYFDVFTVQRIAVWIVSFLMPQLSLFVLNACSMLWKSYWVVWTSQLHVLHECAGSWPCVLVCVASRVKPVFYIQVKLWNSLCHYTRSLGTRKPLGRPDTDYWTYTPYRKQLKEAEKHVHIIFTPSIKPSV